MGEKEQLKNQLIEIRDNDWLIPEDIDKNSFALKLMDNIGSTDGEFRDELILSFLWGMITEDMLSREALRELMRVALSDKHLFYRLGELENDSVFNRAFTVLIIGYIIQNHNGFGRDLFSKEEIDDIFEKVVRYIRLEKDLRGYVEGKGWAHAVAHFGDAIGTIALYENIKHHQLLDILEVIKEKVAISYYTYANEEAERLVSAVIYVVQRQIVKDEEILGWIRSFESIEKPSEFPQLHYFKENVKDFLRSLYFRLKFKKLSPVFMEEIEGVLNNLNSRFNSK